MYMIDRYGVLFCGLFGTHPTQSYHLCSICCWEEPDIICKLHHTCECSRLDRPCGPLTALLCKWWKAAPCWVLSDVSEEETTDFIKYVTMSKFEGVVAMCLPQLIELLWHGQESGTLLFLRNLSGKQLVDENTAHVPVACSDIGVGCALVGGVHWLMWFASRNSSYLQLIWGQCCSLCRQQWRASITPFLLFQSNNQTGVWGWWRKWGRLWASILRSLWAPCSTSLAMHCLNITPLISANVRASLTLATAAVTCVCSHRMHMQ